MEGVQSRQVTNYDWFVIYSEQTSISQQNTALGANSGDRSSAASSSSPSSVAVGSGDNGGNGPVASNNSGGGGGHRGGGGKGSRYVPPHMRSGKGGGGFEDNGEELGRGGYDQEQGGDRGEGVKE